MIPKERPRAILFDWDNTLVDSWSIIHAALVTTFQAMGREPWSLQETKERVRRSLRDSFPALFGENWKAARKLYLDAFTAIHLERLTVLSGAAELLTQLEREGVYLAVVSNKTGTVLRREADHVGWTPLFKRVVGAGDAAADKPEAAPILLALEGSGIACGETWYVGDTGLDMECAFNAGCVGVLLGPGEDNDDGLQRFPPALRFLDLAGLMVHLRRS